jgi:HlyD family secretion protein
VFIEHDGRARLRAITVGERNAEVAQVLEGLEPGERVLMHPPDVLSDGRRVTVR